MMHNLKPNDMEVAQYQAVAEGKRCRKHWEEGWSIDDEVRAKRPLTGQSSDCAFWPR